MLTKPMKLAFLIVFLFSFLDSVAQPDCNCRSNFEEINQKVTDNYAAYDLKIKGNKKQLEKLTKTVRAEAAKISESGPCFELINTWLEFFKDNHLYVNPGANYIKPEAQKLTEDRAKAQKSEKYKSEQEFNIYLVENASKLDPLEGVWLSEDGDYRIGIIKTSETTLVGFLLNSRGLLWDAGKHKFEIEKKGPEIYKVTYYYSDFTKEVQLGKLIKNYFKIENIYRFNKISPFPRITADNTDISRRLPDYRVELLENNTVHVVLPPFTMPNAYLFASEMIKQNGEMIGAAKNLIIDLRNNPGGDEGAFDELFPFISDIPIVRKGSKVRQSQENYIILSHELRAISDVPLYKPLVPKLQSIVEKMQPNGTGFVTVPDKTFYPVKGLKAPQKVILLVNGQTASTAESICLEAKQSKKVTIMGTQTKGACDYTETREWSLNCFSWRLGIPLGYSQRLPALPLENIGIKPDVLVPDTEIDWIKFAQQYLNKIP
jgi:hypothetical protein